MDRLSRKLAASALGLLLVAPGCRMTRPEVPPGRPYANDGRQRKAIEFSSEGHPVNGAATANVHARHEPGRFEPGLGDRCRRQPARMLRLTGPRRAVRAAGNRRPRPAGRAGRDPARRSGANLAGRDASARRTAPRRPRPDAERPAHPRGRHRPRTRSSRRRSRPRARWAPPTRCRARTDRGDAARPMNESPAVLWEDPHGLAVAKPAGMLTQGRRGRRGDARRLVRRYLRPDDPASIYLGTVHRLDRPVSGVILWAKTPKAARRWAEQFARREVRKEYWAIVERGRPTDSPTGLWDDWLARPDAAGRARIVRARRGPGSSARRPAFEVGRRRDRPRRLRLGQAPTRDGRTHQLRAQAARAGLPIVGDATYGATRAFRRAGSRFIRVR